MSNTEITYTRRIPEEWPGLVETITDQLGDDTNVSSHTFSDAQANHALALVHDQLPDIERLEANAFYGFGLGMPAVAQALQNKDQRNNVVATLGQEMAANRLNLEELIASQRFDDRTFANIVGSTTETFQTLAQVGYNAGPPAEHLLSDSLTTITNERRAGMGIMVEGSRHSIKPILCKKVARGDMAASYGGANALAGSIIMYQHGLRVYSRTTTAENNTAGINTKALNTASIQAARLHTTEFANPGFLQSLLTADNDGVLRFMRSLVPNQVTLPPQKPGSSTAQRAERLTCPAVNVGPLIGLVVGLIPDIIEYQREVIS